ncbi:MAG: DNA starvation/stationary phase protection protein, partial [Flavisolibacter sp.]|nr:DNA starvation/stationary phase protection protein [Flavisolibacter sp.]
FSDYIETANIQEAKNVSDGKQAMQIVLDAFRTLIQLEREIAGYAEEAADEGTMALMSDYIREQEKMVWMYSAYLK